MDNKFERNIPLYDRFVVPRQADGNFPKLDEGQGQVAWTRKI